MTVKQPQPGPGGITLTILAFIYFGGCFSFVLLKLTTVFYLVLFWCCFGVVVVVDKPPRHRTAIVAIFDNKPFYDVVAPHGHHNK